MPGGRPEVLSRYGQSTDGRPSLAPLAAGPSLVACSSDAPVGTRMSDRSPLGPRSRTLPPGSELHPATAQYMTLDQRREREADFVVGQSALGGKTVPSDHYDRDRYDLFTRSKRQRASAQPQAHSQLAGSLPRARRARHAAPSDTATPVRVDVVFPRVLTTSLALPRSICGGITRNRQA